MTKKLLVLVRTSLFLTLYTTTAVALQPPPPGYFTVCHITGTITEVEFIKAHEETLIGQRYPTRFPDRYRLVIEIINSSYVSGAPVDASNGLDMTKYCPRGPYYIEKTLLKAGSSPSKNQRIAGFVSKRSNTLTWLTYELTDKQKRKIPCTESSLKC